MHSTAAAAEPVLRPIESDIHQAVIPSASSKTTVPLHPGRITKRKGFLSFKLALLVAVLPFATGSAYPPQVGGNPLSWMQSGIARKVGLPTVQIRYKQVESMDQSLPCLSAPDYARTPCGLRLLIH